MEEREQGRLKQVARFAREIGTYLGDILTKQERPVHFRPSSTGITLISLDPAYPQLGRGGYKAKYLCDNFKRELEKRHEDELKKTTPEKHLQSFLIRNAYQHKRQMEAFWTASDRDPTADLVFVTDELPLYEAGGKQVCDLLAIRRMDSDPGVVIPVLVELKSARQMKQLVGQLKDYAGVMKTYEVEIASIVAGLLKEDVRFAPEPELWLVWPAANAGLKVDHREGELNHQGIRVVQYALDDGQYRFHVGQYPGSR